MGKSFCHRSVSAHLPRSLYLSQPCRRCCPLTLHTLVNRILFTTPHTFVIFRRHKHRYYHCGLAEATNSPVANLSPTTELRPSFDDIRAHHTYAKCLSFNDLEDHDEGIRRRPHTSGVGVAVDRCHIICTVHGRRRLSAVVPFVLLFILCRSASSTEKFSSRVHPVASSCYRVSAADEKISAHTLSRHA